MSLFKKIFNRKKNLGDNRIEPDEIFLDASNLPNFDVNQFEGRFEKPITKKTIFILGVFFMLVGLIFIVRVSVLQIIEGKSFKKISESNRLHHTPLFSERGIIYDRNGVELAWNSPRDDVFPKRSYTSLEGLSNLLGYIKYPQKDNKGIYYQTKFIGKDGIEKYYNDELSGKNGLKIVEMDALMRVRSESVIQPPKNGKDITLTVDSRIQSKLYSYMKSLAKRHDFSGGAAVIMSVKTGGVLALATFPEYNSSILSEGSNIKAIRSFQNNKRKPFLDRPVSGLYAPGSIVKPFVAIGALTEGVITPDKKILSTGSISVQNPYYPKLKSVFKDWRRQGWVDMRDALAVSSDVYFYEVGGGYKDQKGIGIMNIKKYAEKFGLSELTNIDMPREAKGVIPDPAWKAKNFNGEKWYLGDTYHTAIGQYGFQITPIQMARGIAAIASDGRIVTPHMILGAPVKSRIIDGIKKSSFDVVKEGMRQAVLSGSAKGLNVPEVEIAAKTGTAEIGVYKKRVNAWVVGFFPYKNPKYAFAVVMSKGPSQNEIGGLFIMREIIDWMSVNTPQYLK